ncbi:MAG: hypothetical protein ACPLKQ_01115 [Candidatus Bathyarchaeales archaeon]
MSRAVEKAIAFFKDTREPYALLWLNVIYRRFGVSEFADALQRYDQLIAEKPEQAPLLRVFRRIAVYDNRLQAGDLQAVTAEVDLITVPALYCDRSGLPDNYTATLAKAVSRGEYMLTHALLAVIWVCENGCEGKLPKDFIESVYCANAALINDDQMVNDLELEAAAFLYLAGQGARVDYAFIERVIAVQNDDGGWSYSSDSPGESNWHSSILGLLLLLHVKFPSDSYPTMLAPPYP